MARIALQQSAQPFRFNQLQKARSATGTTTYLFDANGNQEFILNPDASRATMVWDYENRQSSTILPASRITYTYDPNGLRFEQTL